MNPPRVNADRLLRSMAAMSAIGATSKGGVHRLTLSDADREARNLLVAWLRETGLRVRIDTFGNIFGRLEGSDATAPIVLTGSHLDTQPFGGRFDGAYGVLAALEAVRCLAERPDYPRRSVEVVAWTNEEGSRFQPTLLGSGVYTGHLDATAMYGATDVGGCTFRDELARIGFLGEALCRADPIHRYFELHIEQGPVLDREGIPIGIVTGLVGLEWFEATFRGQANHSGTTPMEGRRNALLCAAEVITAVDRIPSQLEAEYAVATVGHLRVEPNSINIVPGVVHLTIDVRATDTDNLRSAAVLAERAVQDAARRHHLGVDYRRVASSEPQVFDAGCIALVERAVEALNVPFRRMVSGAAHDANNLNRICPTSMIFVPSVGGISHNEAEYTSDKDLKLGTEVLLGVITLAAEEEVGR